MRRIIDLQLALPFARERPIIKIPEAFRNFLIVSVRHGCIAVFFGEASAPVEGSRNFGGVGIQLDLLFKP